MEKHYGGISNGLVNALFGIMLILGFFSWAGVSDTMTYVLFLFTYLLIITYWFELNSFLKKYPSKNIWGFLADMTAVFAILILIVAASFNLGFYFAALAILRTVDTTVISRILSEYDLKKAEAFRLKEIRSIYFLEATAYVLLEPIAFGCSFSNVFGITSLILIWLFARVFEKRLL